MLAAGVSARERGAIFSIHGVFKEVFGWFGVFFGVVWGWSGVFGVGDGLVCRVGWGGWVVLCMGCRPPCSMCVLQLPKRGRVPRSARSDFLFTDSLVSATQISRLSHFGSSCLAGAGMQCLVHFLKVTAKVPHAQSRRFHFCVQFFSNPKVSCLGLLSGLGLKVYNPDARGPRPEARGPEARRPEVCGPTPERGN